MLCFCLLTWQTFSGEPGSHVFGSLIEGVFQGKIISPRDGDFYVEKAHYYFPKEANHTFHSVIYHSQDVTDPYAERRSGKSQKLVDDDDS